jgi:hypothetical protein
MAVALIFGSFVVVRYDTLAYNEQSKRFQAPVQQWTKKKFLMGNLEQSHNKEHSEPINAEKVPGLVVTALHRLRLTRQRDVPLGQLALVEEAGDKLVLLHLSEDGSLRKLDVTLSKDPPVWQVKGIGKLTGVANVALGHSNDIFVSSISGKIYVSYPYVDVQGCASLKLDEVFLNEAGLLDTQSTVYETKPCVLPPYGLHNTGGRIVENSSGLILTVGDFSKAYLVEDNSTDLGKILSLSSTGKASLISKGHRNPQGLFYDRETDMLIETEHGPQGGDEINIIRPNVDYGWPHVSYGTGYGQVPEDPVDADTASHFGTHEGYEKPIFAFVPDIGIGQIAKLPMSSYEFPRWLGNYLVAGMLSGSLYRIEFDQQHLRVILIEPIPIARIRDFVVAPTGLIICSSSEGVIIIQRDKAVWR